MKKLLDDAVLVLNSGVLESVSQLIRISEFLCYS